MKFYGKVGYVRTYETRPGVWEEEVSEREYYGDVTRHMSRWESAADKINDNIIVNNELSILADPYMYEHFSEIRYVEFMDAKWKVASITVDRPRLTLTLGGLYNGYED